MNTFENIRRQSWYHDDPDVRSIGHTKQRTKFRKKENRRARRVMKQNLQQTL